MGEGQGGNRVRCEEMVDEGKLGGADEDGRSTGVGVLRGGRGFGNQGYLEGGRFGRVGGSSRVGVDRW